MILFQETQDLATKPMVVERPIKENFKPLEPIEMKPMTEDLKATESMEVEKPKQEKHKFVSSSRQNNVVYDPSEELFGVDFQPRGRGYTSCPNCGIERSRLDCLECKGKGIMTCLRCLRDCVIWEELIDERPWEKARPM